MRYWVISPNVLAYKKEHPIKNFINIMEKDNIALMGWKEDTPLGAKFENDVKLGDIIIISLRVNWERKDYFVGIVDSDSYHYNYQDRYIQARKLKNFTYIKEKISWDKNCTNESNQTPPAIYELNESNKYDNKVIKEFLNILNIVNIKKDNRMEEYVKLLKENYNLILTGAPGTGKTYLAKQIAAKIIFDDDKKEYTEELEEDENFKNQYEFVQFHPSYDYTDFVEGLRPIKDSSGNIGFERKDGVFKEFCKKALKNLIDSKKDISQLNEDAIIKNNLLKFVEDIGNEIDQSQEKLFKLNSIDPKRKVASIKEIELLDDTTISFDIDTKSNHNIKKSLDSMIRLYKIFISKSISEWDRRMLINAFGFESRITYFYGFLRAFYEKYNSEIEKELNNNNTVEKVERKNFVFIIDEINRGEISKIFGELFFAIDPGYRGVKGKVLTQYSNLIDEELEKYFYIPENVYIMGTMNDIDRSVESMDFAMRRRFAWKEIKAEDTQESILKDLDDSIKQDAIDRMNALNNAISEIEGFNSSYHIGASYFLKLKNYYNGNNKEDAFKSLWDNHLKGLLFEYLRGMPDINDKLKKLEYSYNVLPANNTKQDTNDNNIDN